MKTHYLVTVTRHW